MTDRREQANRRKRAHSQPEDERATVRNLTNEQQARTVAVHAGQAAIKKGLDSGVSEKTLRQIWTEAEQRHQVRNG